MGLFHKKRDIFGNTDKSFNNKNLGTDYVDANYVDKRTKEVENQIDDFKSSMSSVMEQSRTMRDNIVKNMADTGSLPIVSLHINNQELLVMISPDDFHKGRDRAERSYVDKVYSNKDAIRYNWLYFWQTQGNSYPQEFDYEFDNFTKLYGTPFREFMNVIEQNPDIYGEMYKQDKSKKEEIIKEIVAEYKEKFPPEEQYDR